MDFMAGVGYSADSPPKGIILKLFRGETSRELVVSKSITIISNSYPRSTKILAYMISR